MRESTGAANTVWSPNKEGLHNPYGAGSDMSWVEYERLRPTYPSQLFDILAEYMGNHNHGDKELCIDYGSGSGIIVPQLLERCGMKKVIGTDISSCQLEQGRAKLQSVYGHDRFEIIVGSAGNLDSIPDKSIDLITAAEAVHWFDRQKWLKEVARILRPSGTLAFWHYWAEPFITTHPEATPAVAQLLKRFYELSIPERTVTQDQVVYSLSLLDSVRIDSSEFLHQTRRKWMLPKVIHEQLEGDGHPLSWMLKNPDAVAEARASAAQEFNVHVFTPENAEAAFMRDTNWTTTTLMQCLKIAIGAPIDNVLADEIFKKNLDMIEHIVGGPQGTFDVAWTTALFIGTRA